MKEYTLEEARDEDAVPAATAIPSEARTLLERVRSRFGR